MRLIKRYILFSCLLVIHCHTLSCRSKYGPKDEQLKRIFNDCLRQQEGNSSSDRQHEQDRMDRTNHHRNNYDRDRNERDERNERNGNKDNMRDDYNGGSYSRNSREQADDSKRTEVGRNSMGGRNNRKSNSNRMDSGRGRSDMNQNSHLNGQDEFLESEEYGNQNFYSSPPSNGRYKREKKIEMNSGQRSQYNPHSTKNNGNRDNDSNEGNSSENTNKDVACALHCFLENLQMTGDDGMPDRYLITHALTKDERNEDLRDFLQESIEECFQILDNENTEDKCEFAKNLWMCLSEKGKANCDDWPKKTSFMF